MDPHNPITQEYLDTEVLTKESGPHVVYVTWPEDTFYPHLMPWILDAVPADSEVKVVTAKVDDTMAFCQKYQVLFIPTIFFFRRGRSEATMSGFIPAENLRKIISDLVSPTTVEQLNERIDAAKKAMAEGLPADEVERLLKEDQ
ncbi:hypothetical protein [Nocardia phage NC1]|nr:hypothetical protein [Nocardia phage NC1]QSL67717.1 thioredoxin [Nocardia phage P69]